MDRVNDTCRPQSDDNTNTDNFIITVITGYRLSRTHDSKASLFVGVSYDMKIMVLAKAGPPHISTNIRTRLDIKMEQYASEHRYMIITACQKYQICGCPAISISESFRSLEAHRLPDLPASKRPRSRGMTLTAHVCPCSAPHCLLLG